MPGFLRLSTYLTLLITIVAITATAAPEGETTLLGAGFAGRPVVLRDDIVMESNGLFEAVRDYADVQAPEFLGWYDHSVILLWSDVLLDGDLLVALGGGFAGGGLNILDVADPAQPVLLSEFSGNTYTSGRLAHGVLTLSTPGYLVTYDLADPGDPVFGSLVVVGANEDPRWFSQVGTVLYIRDQSTTLRALDIADPLHPVDLGTVPLAGDRVDALVAGDGHLYVLLATADEAGGERLELLTLDTSVPLAPMETDRQVVMAGPTAHASELVNDGSMLVVAASDDHLRAYGLDDPAHPAAGWTVEQEADHVTFSTRMLLAANASESVFYERTDYLTMPSRELERPFLPRLKQVLGNGTSQFAQDYDQTNLITPIDVSNPLLPTLGTWFDAGLNGDFFVNEDLGLMVNRDVGWQLVDLTDTDAIAPLGPLVDQYGELRDLAFSQESLVIATLKDHFLKTRFFDLRDPLNPVEADTTVNGDPLAIGGKLCVFRGYNLVFLMDLVDPLHPVLRGTIPLGDQAKRALIHEGYLYVITASAETPYRLHVYDIHDPDFPQEATVFELGFTPTRMTINGNRLYFTTYFSVRIYDISDPELTFEAARFTSAVTGGPGIAVTGDQITFSGWLITVRDDGLLPTAVPDPIPAAACRLESVYPNPFNPSTSIAFSLAQRRDLTVSIHDVRGRLVAELARGVFEPGRHELQWHGKHADGRGAASGVYLVRVHGAGIEATGTMTLVK